MQKCPNCNADLPKDNLFCTKCGNKIPKQGTDQSTVASDREETSEESLETIHDDNGSQEIIRGQTDLKKLLPILALIGVIIIFISLFELVIPIIGSINFLTLSIIMLSLGGMLTMTGLYSIITNKFGSLTQIILISVGEMIIFSLSYANDTVYRSELTRYLFLVTILAIYSIGIVIPEIKKLELPGKMWQLASTYVGFIMMIQLGGSNYYSRIFYSAALLLIIILAHLIVIRYSSVYLLFWILPLEFFTLLQSSVINSTVLFPTSLLIIGSLPVFLFLFYDGQEVLTINGRSWFEILLLLPQISLVFTLANGALVSPQPEILIIVFVGLWSLYTIYYGRQESSQDHRGSEGFSSILAILSFALIGFSLSNQFLSALAVIVVLMAFSVINLPEDTKITTRIAISVAVVSFSQIILLLLHQRPALIIFIITILAGMLQYGVLMYTSSINHKEVTVFYQIWFALITAIIYLLRVESVLILPTNLLLQLVLLYTGSDHKFSTSITALTISVPSLTVINHVQNGNFEWYILILQLIAIIFFLIFDKSVNKMLNATILALPLIFILSAINNNYFINATIGLLVAISMLIQFYGSNEMEKTLLTTIILTGSIYLRDIVTSTEGIFLGFNYIILTTIGIFVVFTGILGYHLITNLSSNYNLVLFTGWLTSSSYLIYLLELSQHIIVMNGLYFISATIILIVLGIVSWNITDKIPISTGLSTLLLAYGLVNQVMDYYYLPLIASLLFMYISNTRMKLSNDAGMWIILLWLIIQLVYAFILGPIFDWLFLGIVIWFQSIFIFPGFVRKMIKELIPKFQELVRIAGVLIGFGLYRSAYELNWIEPSLMVIGSILTSTIILFNVYYFSRKGIGALYSTVIALGSIIVFTAGVKLLMITIVTLVSTVLLQAKEPGLIDRKSSSFIPEFNLFSISTALVYLVVLVETGFVMIGRGWIDYISYTRGLILIGLLSIGFATVLDQRGEPSNLSNGLLFLGSATFIISTFIGFFDQVTSNILFGTSAIISAIIGLYNRREDIFRLAIALSGLSVIKALIDWFTLDQVGRSLSLLIVGVQIISYVLIANNIETDYFNKQQKNTMK